MTEADTRSERLDRGVSELWDRFRPRFLERVDVLEKAVVALLDGELDPEMRRQAEREAHKLAGSLGTFGSSEGTRLARSIELLLAGSEALGEAAPLKLSEWLVALRREVEQTPPSATLEAPADQVQLLLATTDPQLAEGIDLEASARGFAVRRLQEREPGTGAVTAPPAAVILDFGGLPAEGRSRLLRVFAAGPAAPRTIILSPTENLDERLDAARRGGTTLLRSAASPRQIVDAVERALMRRSATGARLLAVDDDPVMRPLLRALLTGSGLDVHVVASVENFWSELIQVVPDVVLLDLDMPGHDGVDLCRAIRADPRWSAMPVLFLTGRADADSIHAIFAAGADDFVAKPVVGPELLLRIENRLERAALQAAAHASAGPGGLPGRGRSREEASRMLQLAARARVTVAIGRVRLELAATAAAEDGGTRAPHARNRVATLLQAAADAGDLVGWWGPDDLVLGIFAKDRDDALRQIGEASQLLAEGEGGSAEVLLTAGVAVYPDDGGDFTELIAAAEDALASACREGELSMVPYRAESGRGRPERVDVVVVEDDSVLAELLLHALSVQGYSTRWLRDGEEAAELLAGARPTLRARAIVLDIDLPVRDGLSVLRALSEAAVVERTRVIMLTVRATEREVLMALELGAADHIAKPFSIPVFLRRLRNLLERG